MTRPGKYNKRILWKWSGCMKRALLKILIFLLILGLLAGAAWYLILGNPQFTAGVLANWGSGAMEGQRYSSAIRWYRWANRLDPENQDISVRLADAYRADGNYTKAEFTLANAIAAGGSAEVYLKLCQVYVEQDKLLDAVTMLDQIADPSVKAQLDAQRPTAPTADLEPGYYSEYQDVTLFADSGTLYVNTQGEFPSVSGAYTGPISLDLGERDIWAVAVADNGLVSPLATFRYTVAGVVEPVELSDPALDACVRALLSRGSGSQLTTADLWGITELTVPEDAADLSDLGYFTGLTSLTIQNRPAADLSFLESCTDLEYLDLSGTTVDAAYLPLIGSLTNLKTLNLSRCSLSTLSGLETAAALTELDASVNSISDLSPLSGCTGLTKLDLHQNAVTGAAALRTVSGLTWLDLNSNALKDFSPISGCGSLQYLDVSNNSLSSLGGIGSLTALTYLDASDNSLANVSGIGSCTALVTLDLSNNVLDNMDEMVSLTLVQTMDLSYNDILTIPDFPDDAALAVFNGCHNFFEDVSGLAGLQSLNYVYLDYNNISDINVLSGCPRLIQVNVFRTNVTDISDLQDMDVIVSYNPT